MRSTTASSIGVTEASTTIIWLREKKTKANNYRKEKLTEATILSQVPIYKEAIDEIFTEDRSKGNQ